VINALTSDTRLRSSINDDCGTYCTTDQEKRIYVQVEMAERPIYPCQNGSDNQRVQNHNERFDLHGIAHKSPRTLTIFQSTPNLSIYQMSAQHSYTQVVAANPPVRQL